MSRPDTIIYVTNQIYDKKILDHFYLKSRKKIKRSIKKRILERLARAAKRSREKRSKVLSKLHLLS
jgi:hypothetical protein